MFKKIYTSQKKTFTCKFGYVYEKVIQWMNKHSDNYIIELKGNNFRVTVLYIKAKYITRLAKIQIFFVIMFHIFAATFLTFSAVFLIFSAVFQILFVILFQKFILFLKEKKLSIYILKKG
jgi:hypothetical protein